jgi:hypothetical protein
MEQAGVRAACSINQQGKLSQRQKRSTQGAETKLNFRSILLAYFDEETHLTF